MENSIERLLLNYSNARQSWEAWCFMINFNCKKPGQERVRYIDTHDLLFHLRYLAMKNFYIEMYKVLRESGNNKDSVFALLKRKQKEDVTKYDAVELNLSELDKCRDTTKRILELRDKYYAHLDEKYENYLNQGFLLDDITQCFVAVENSIITLTSLKTLQSYLEKVLSRDEFVLSIEK